MQAETRSHGFTLSAERRSPGVGDPYFRSRLDVGRLLPEGWEVEVNVGPAGVLVVVLDRTALQEDPLALDTTRLYWLHAAWGDLAALPSRDDGELNDTIKAALKRLVVPIANRQREEF
jgi:hypothetical protein